MKAKWSFVTRKKGPQAEYSIYRDDSLPAEKMVVDRFGEGRIMKRPLVYYQLDGSETPYYSERALMRAWKDRATSMAGAPG